MGAGRVSGLLRLERNVSDLAAAVAFYQEGLGFAVLKKDDRLAQLKWGAQEIWLARPDTPGQLYPKNATAADPWFQHAAVVTPDINASFDRLQRHGFMAITHGGPQILPPSTGPVTAYKFRDPDGHPLELIHFPHDARMAGIDHSAISVADAPRSITFYRDLLGLHLAARQINRGPEQERLDGLPEDVVEIIALEPAAQARPHLELLAYQIPLPSTQALWAINDIVADRLVFAVDDLEVLLARLKSASQVFMPLDDGRLVIRDPDGHFLELVQS